MTGGSGVEKSLERFMDAMEKIYADLREVTGRSIWLAEHCNQADRLWDKTGEHAEKIIDLTEVTMKPKTFFVSESSNEPHIWRKELEAAKVESPCDQSSGESFFLDESVLETADLPTYGESRTEHDYEDNIQQSCSRKEVVPFVDDDVYVDIGQTHGGLHKGLAIDLDRHKQSNNQFVTLTFSGKEFHDDGTSQSSRHATYNDGCFYLFLGSRDLRLNP
ncbi:hypothetical protein ACLB2K_020570 [Fragaria x ananassa]